MIREIEKSDLEEVFNLIYSSFGSNAEPDLVKQLILDGDVLVNLVLELSGNIIGNLVVSKITMEPDVGLFCGGIAPVAVLPDQQSSGIGSQLITEAINECKNKGMDALFLLGDPSYYKRFGFIVSRLKNDYSAEHFQELELTEGCLVDVKSKVTYANAFLNL